MATTARQPKPQRKGGVPEPAARRAPAWSNARASPTYSPSNANARLPNGAPAASPGAFPPLGQPNGASNTPPPRPQDGAPQDRVLSQLSGLIGTTITLTTKTHVRYEGSVASTSGEGDTTGVTLRDVKEISNPGAPLRETLFIASTNIDQWSSGPADAKPPTTNGDSFKSDTDISKTAGHRERELQAWQPTDDTSASTAPAGASGAAPNGGTRDDMTFGPGAANGGAWNQFEANERLFGVKANFDEDLYTTKLDRNAPDFKERERRAAVIANEILQSQTSNVHIAEERTKDFVGEGKDEEEKYGAVVRGANAYVPPGARKVGQGGPTPPAGAKQDIPRVAVNSPDGTAVPGDKEKEKEKAADAAKTGSPAPGANKPTADAVPAFRDFVSNEKDRLMKKKQALMKNEMERRMAELVKFSQSFKLNKPIPEDLVPILAKDEEKQRQIKEKSTKDAESTQARAISTSATLTVSPSASRALGSPAVPANPPSSAKPPAAALGKNASAASKPAAGKEQGKGRIPMVIQSIPPFKGKRAPAPAPAHAQSAAVQSQRQGIASPLSPTAVNRLNVNASSFRPTVKSVSPPGGSPNPNGTSSSTASPKVKAAEGSASPTQGPPNPFFGTRLPKKGMVVHMKEDFNPFKHHKVTDANQVGATWPYSGKRYMHMFPPLPQPQQQSPPMAHPPPPSMQPPPPYEPPEDAAAQAATRGYVYAYPQYYHGQYGQPMMPGMAPPPPGAYIPAGPQFMQPMPYPHMPPNGMYPGAPMGQMPPPQAYMQQAPPGYPVPPNGAGHRPSMPPTPIPSHAHPYYQQSPQLQHAVPYQMMMPPPGPHHSYDPSQAPPVSMGGVGHA
ncbi:uncharacterized protein C8Q71DRAFT_751533 [Rhodofomes roseus]|uniref:LsmAD domain-containing protein n=1 Tax=Rhodofomes roseus TaxID=34475 RepID=A0ABQ8KK16_9APHY|nr:uncharacterized protein C8Q71DRAFT_751533 [Rhodofomes roseus]KAH9838493.1 hypothetical protein C8Q71DRAFT_751533 [Rhodofomes roseus]